MSRSCLACGAHHADDAKFCRACGTALPAAAAPKPPTACPACGHTVRPGSLFCSQCGAGLTRVVATGTGGVPGAGTSAAAATASAPGTAAAAPGPAAAATTSATASAAASAASDATAPPGTESSQRTHWRDPVVPRAAPTFAGARRPAMLWPALGGAAVVLAGFMLWWYGAMRVPVSPSFDAAPPPVALDAERASSVALGASSVAPSSHSGVAAPSTDLASRTSARSAEIGRAAATGPGVPVEVIGPDGVITETADGAVRASTAAGDTRRTDPGLAPAAAATAAIDPAGQASPAAPTAPPPASAPRHRSTPSARPEPRAAVAPTAFRTAQQRCADLSLLPRSICQSRECARPEHASEPMCQRIRAAEDRRREP